MTHARVIQYPALVLRYALRFASLFSLVCALASPAVAQEAALDPDRRAEAQAHFEAGTAAFDTGDYARAAAEFRRAHALTGHPDLLFNVYSALERGGVLVEAAEALERYLEEGDFEPDRRDALSARLARLEARVAEERAAQAEAELERERAARDADQREERLTNRDLAPPPPPEPASGVHPAGIGVLIGAGVLAASFGVFAGLSEAEDASLASECGRDNPTTTCTESRVETLRLYNTVADVSWIAAAAAGITGVILLFALPPEASATDAAWITPWASPVAGGLAAGGSF